jgi:hypothetical protein
MAANVRLRVPTVVLRNPALRSDQILPLQPKNQAYPKPADRADFSQEAEVRTGPGRSQERTMNEDAFNLSIRKFLKQFGVTAQREIENGIRSALENGRLKGDETLPVRATLTLPGLIVDYHVDGDITLR